MEGGVHEVLFESVDVLYLTVLYLTFNLIQECGLEQVLEPAFLMKHGGNLKKQHETLARLTWTRSVHTKSCDATHEAMEYTVSRTERREVVAVLQGKIVKPYDYVPRDFSMLLLTGGRKECVRKRQG